MEPAQVVPDGVFVQGTPVLGVARVHNGYAVTAG